MNSSRRTWTEGRVIVGFRHSSSSACFCSCRISASTGAWTSGISGPVSSFCRAYPCSAGAGAAVPTDGSGSASASCSWDPRSDSTGCDIDFIWPLLIIAIGLMLLFRSKPIASPSGTGGAGCLCGIRKGRTVPTGSSGIRGVSDTSDSPEILWILGGTHHRIESRRFRGAQVTSVLSKGKVDLTRAELEGEASLDVLSILGTVEILVPEGWEIVIRGTSLIGDMKNETAVRRSRPANRFAGREETHSERPGAARRCFCQERMIPLRRSTVIPSASEPDSRRQPS